MPVGAEVSGDGRSARAWASIEYKINLGGYESITVANGGSKEVPNSDRHIQAAQRKLLATARGSLDELVGKLKESYSNTESWFLG